MATEKSLTFFSIDILSWMQSYHFPPPKYRLPPPRYLQPPTNIPLSDEDEYQEGAKYIPSRLIGPLLDFEGVEMSLIHQNAGECIARILTKTLNPDKPLIYHTGGDHMSFTNRFDGDGEDEDGEITFMILPAMYSVEAIPPDYEVESLQRIDYRNPNITSLNRINSLDLESMSMMEVPQRWRDRGVGEDSANTHFSEQPSYWRKMIEFLDRRTPVFIQKVRDEISRRYIVLTTPYNNSYERLFFEALEKCRMSGVLPNLQKGLNARQRRVERHGLTEISRNKNTPWNVTRSIAKFVGPNMKARRGRKTLKARRTRKRM